jgi:Fe2+ or Zn2+ uptake regulation protein
MSLSFHIEIRYDYCKSFAINFFLSDVCHTVQKMKDLLNQAYEVLHKQGGRMTTQRRLILETLSGLSDHPTADELFHLAQQSDPSINLSTVYRTLNWLLDENLIQSHAFDEERYHKHFDANPQEGHSHFLCTACNSVIEFDSLLLETIKKQFTRQTKALIHNGEITLYGLCAECREKEEKP